MRVLWLHHTSVFMFHVTVPFEAIWKSAWLDGWSQDGNMYNIKSFPSLLSKEDSIYSK